MGFEIIGVLVATVVSYIIGAIWYSVLFGKIWMKGAGLKKSETKPTPGPFIFMFINTFIMLYALNVFLSYVNVQTIGSGLIVALFTWVGFIATTQMGGVLWENKPVSYYLVNAVHYLVVLLVSSVVLVMM